MAAGSRGCRLAAAARPATGLVRARVTVWLAATPSGSRRRATAGSRSGWRCRTPRPGPPTRQPARAAAAWVGSRVPRRTVHQKVRPRTRIKVRTMVRLVTGGTGFIGRFLLRELAKREGTTYVLVRQRSLGRFESVVSALPGGERLRPMAGDIHESMLGLSASDRDQLRGADIFHLAAVYDLEASSEAAELANVTGTRNAIALAESLDARIHHMSSVAVAGAKWKGKFTEEMFAEGQLLDHPYYKTKYESERLVRESGLRLRIYRPGLVIGSSETGEADRIDGPYYAFKLIQRLRDALPSWVPLIGLEGGHLNLVPVDFVARAVDAIAHRPDLDGRTFHLTDPAARPFGEVVNEFCRAAHAPQFTLR